MLSGVNGESGVETSCRQDCVSILSRESSFYSEWQKQVWEQSISVGRGNLKQKII